jgi:hypothetical protein
MQDPSRAPFDFVADQAETDAQAGLFGVYLSAIDYDDNFYTLMDSIPAYRQHRFHYDEGIASIAKCSDYDSAKVIAEDLHQVILSESSVVDFQERHNLKIPDPVRQQIREYQNATDFSIYEQTGDEIIPICRSMGWDLVCLQFDENQDEEDFYDDLEITQAVIEELRENEQYDRLDQLRAALKIGKFAFVHPTPETQC